jgi:hypothetical protein
MKFRNKTVAIFLLILFCGLLLSIVRTAPLQAQNSSGMWANPRLLSTTNAGEKSEAQLVADPHGFIHVLWKEHDASTNVDIIYYAAFDGEVWTQPIDIYITAPTLSIPSYSASLGPDGRLYLAWSEGTFGPAFISSAPALEAGSAASWSSRRRLDFSASWVELHVDSKGTPHLVYLDTSGREPGVYYSYAMEDGEVWAYPFWIDSDIPTDAGPHVLQFEMDDRDGLHVSWYYEATTGGQRRGLWIRYAHSLDGGQTWQRPVTIDVADDADDELRLPYPGLAVSGDTVLMVYAGNYNTNREFRYSRNRGVTWSETERVFGDLAGQALGDAMIVDALGRIHFFGQIRWPQGVYHAMLDPSQPELEWTEPQMSYLIAESDAIGRQGRYHAHSVRGGVLNGNELIVTFSDEANGPIYAMWRELGDVEPLEAVVEASPTPLPTATSTPLPEATAVPTPPPFANTPLTVPEEAPGVANSIWLGVIPTILLVAFVAGWQIYRRRNW